MRLLCIAKQTWSALYSKLCAQGSSVEIIRIDQSSLEEYAQLFVSTFSLPPWNEQWPVSSAQERLECYQKSPNFVGLAAYELGELVGFALGNFEPYQAKSMYFLKEMCVSVKQQNQGVGSKLISELHTLLGELGVYCINLLTAKGSLAESFYVKSGYKEASSFSLLYKVVST